MDMEEGRVLTIPLNRTVALTGDRHKTINQQKHWKEIIITHSPDVVADIENKKEKSSGWNVSCNILVCD